MIWKVTTLLALVAAAISGCSSADSHRAAQPEISPPSLPQKIAVVRIDRCFSAKVSREARHAEEEESKLRESLDREKMDLEANVKMASDVTIGCPPGSLAQIEYEMKLELAKAQLRAHITYADKRLERTRERCRAMLLKSARDAAREIAAEMDFGLVLSYAEAASDGAVLYANPAWDITDKVVERMNKDYK